MSKIIITTVCLIAIICLAKDTKEAIEKGKNSHDFVVGFIQGFGGPQCNKVEECESTGKDITGDVEHLIAGFRKKNLESMIVGLEALVSLMDTIPEILGECKEAKESLDIVQKKMHKFKNAKYIAS